MKRSLCKTSSAPEPLPRISHRKKTTSNKRQPESKSRHYSDLDISPWRPLTEADTMALPVVLHNRPTQIDRGRPSERQGSMSDRSWPVRRDSDLSFTQGMVTILRTEDEADDDLMYTPTRLYAYDDVPEGSPVPAHSHTHSHCHGLELGTYVNSGLGINHSLGRFRHSEEGKHRLHIHVPANKEVPRRSPVPVHSHTHSHCHGLELGTYVNSGLGINHSLGRFHHREERKNHLHVRVPDNKEVPRRSPVPVHSHTHSHCHGLELGTYVNSGLGINHSLGHFHHREKGKHSSSRSVLAPGGGDTGLHAGPRPRHVSFDRHTHRPRHIKIRIGPPMTPTVSPTGDLGVPVHLGDLGPRGDLPTARSSVREYGGQGNYIHSRTLRDVQPEDEQNTQNDDAKPKLTCPGLTQEVLTSGLYSDSEQREDRVSDWLEECGGKLTPASLPPHLPEIDSER
ncbi:uncharacterized protein LOC124275632 [Haliotis rubra]|uniref:uncharacterized protein LOC124275632 n=1 Tax=Haliotis rubra TaxID=36100 RepID=UPI001EE602DD|nr:uncharacterized protein LOC124275632 [Haliotis rubra]